MNEEDTATAVREILKNSEVVVPEDLLDTLKGSKRRVSYKFGYFDGKRVHDSKHSFRVEVTGISGAETTRFAELFLNSESEQFIIEAEEISDLAEEIGEVQNVVIL